MSTSIEVRPIHSRRELMQFIKFPWKIYADDPNWVPPLLMERKKFLDASKNPFFRSNPHQFYLAYRNGEVVGRIAAIQNLSHNRYYNDKAGFFGFLEAVNDREVFRALLDTVKAWLRERGCDRMLGPMNPSTNDEVAFLIEGFDSPPFFMMTHNPPYYIEIMEALGYAKAKDLYAYYLDTDILKVNPKLDRVCQALEKKHPLKLRTINLKKFDEELEVVRDIYNNAWAPNWGFVPMTREEFDFVANDFKQILHPELGLIGEYKGEPVGFLLALPNYNEVFIKIRNGRLFPFGIFTFLLNKSKIQSIRVITLGIKREYQPLGFGSLFYREIIQRAPRAGFHRAEMSWVLEDNDLMNKAARLLGARIHKKYRIYETAL
ncbi:MAG: GNAT family N-acetyltransferase [Calditrichaeota bacterium]|nr:MAG: GNAT family N-acetyltransferase [Calditrichota bacterium]